LALDIDAKAGLYVPMLYRGRALGALNAFDRLEHGPEFDGEDQRLLESFASSAAVAVATAQNAAAQGLRRSIEAAERERAHWARELHDQTLQDLAALSIRLSSARLEDDLDDLRRRLDDTIDEIGVAAGTLRELISELRPASLDQLGVEPALESLVDRVRQRHPLDVRLDLRLAYGRDLKPDRLAPETESAVFRLVQEALNNVVKHAGATTVQISVTDEEGTVVVQVSDDGRGFVEYDSSEGFGLLGMRERVALLGGSLEVDSAPGSGTTIRATLPIVRAGRRPEAPPRAEPPAAERRPARSA
jgi:signal transduction histidine kinase